MIEIDGSYLEGGGAILRVASALSAVTGEPLRVCNIRAGRENPGLRTQHLEGLKAIASLCSGSLKNAAMGSTEIELHPGKIEPRELFVEISTAGSVGLLFQSLKVPICKADGDVTIHIKGGATFAKWAPPLLTTKHVLLPVLSRIGYSAKTEIKRHGFYPVGGARVEITGHLCKEFKPLTLTEAGEVKELTGISVASEHLRKPRVAERMAESARKIIETSGIKTKIETQYVDAQCPGCGIVLRSETSTGAIISADVMGERGKPAETVGEEAANSLLQTIESGAAVDRHLSDQLLIFMALAHGKSAITAPRLTNHAKTNIHVIQKFLPVEFRITEGKPTLIECAGLR